MGKMCLQVGQNSKTKQGGGRYHITVISLCQFHIQDFPRPFESIPTDCTLQYYTNTRYMLCCSILALWETLGKKSAKIQNPVNYCVLTLKIHVSSPGDFDLRFHLAQNISVFMF